VTLVSNHLKPDGTILVVDDAEIMRTTCQRALERAGYKVITADSGDSALRLLAEQPVEVAVLDIRMPGLSGVELLKEIKNQWPGTEVLMMTAYADTGVAEESLNLGAAGFLVKPFDNIRTLVETVNKSMSRVRIRRGETAEDGPFFEEILRQGGLVTEEEMAKARSVAEKGGFTLRQALSSVKTITPQDIDWAVSNYLDVAYVRLTEKMLDPDLVRSFPAHLAYAYTCLPLFRSGNEMHLVIANPFHPRAAEIIGQELQVTPVLAKGSESEILKFIGLFYGARPKKEIAQQLSLLKDAQTPEREKLLLELLRRVFLAELDDFRFRELGDEEWEIQLTARIKTPPGSKG